MIIQKCKYLKTYSEVSSYENDNRGIFIGYESFGGLNNLGDEGWELCSVEIFPYSYSLEGFLDFMRDGDELVVTWVDRLARSVFDLQDIVKILHEKGVTLSATEKPISTKDATSKCFLDMLSVFAEF